MNAIYQSNFWHKQIRFMLLTGHKYKKNVKFSFIQIVTFWNIFDWDDELYKKYLSQLI